MGGQADGTRVVGALKRSALKVLCSVMSVCNESVCVCAYQHTVH